MSRPRSHPKKSLFLLDINMSQQNDRALNTGPLNTAESGTQSRSKRLFMITEKRMLLEWIQLISQHILTRYIFLFLTTYCMKCQSTGCVDWLLKQINKQTNDQIYHVYLIWFFSWKVESRSHSCRWGDNHKVALTVWDYSLSDGGE